METRDMGPEWAHAIRQYQERERIYAAAVTLLKRRIPRAMVNEYQRLRKAADEARLDVEIARLELDKHLRTREDPRSLPATRASTSTNTIPNVIPISGGSAVSNYRRSH
jgi:hypothetical protein